MMALTMIGPKTEDNQHDARTILEEMHQGATATAITTVVEKKIVVSIVMTVVVDMMFQETKETSEKKLTPLGNKDHKNQKQSRTQTLISTARKH